LFRSPKNLVQAKAELQKDIHLIERALALPEPRRPFGNSPVKRVEDIIANYGDQLGENLLSQAKTVLDNRNSWNDKGLRPKQITLPAATGVEKFLVSRRSVRAFGSDRQITDIELEQVIALAIQAPSVSNTQSWSVRAYRDAQDIGEILKLQNGNVGNSPIPMLLVITVDIRNFTGSNERNQMWIDGGIFLQQLLLSIHALGWASCPMNFSSTNSQANKLRELADIADYEEIICFVSVGEEDRNIIPASSIRKPVQEVLRIEKLRN
jgi:nitroreductase